MLRACFKIGGTMARETAETFSIHDIPIRNFSDRSARWLLSDTENV